MQRTAPRPGKPTHLAPPPIRRHRLRNGLDLLFAARPNLPIIDLQLVLRGGAVLDGQHAGACSMMAEVMDEGAAGLDALEISSRVEQLGIELEPRASWDATVIFLHTLSSRLEPALELFRAVALQPDFPGGELERKRVERLNALAQEREEPRIVASKALAAAIHGDGHPYGQPINGSPASIAALQREQLIGHHQRSASPANAHLAVAGAIEFEALIALAEQYFGDWSAAAFDAGSVAVPDRRPRTIHLLHKPGAAQSELRIGHPAPPRRTPDYFALLVLNTILGGSFKSRLNMTLREEKGYTYGASTGFAFRRSGGVFSGGAAVATDATADAVRLTLAEITALRDAGATADELERARNYIALGFTRHFETTADIAAQLGDLALHELGDDYLAQYPARIAAVTLDDVAEAARRWLDPEHLAIVVVGDRELIERPLRDLAIGPIHHVDPV